jgi:hypothetical protein
MRTLLLIALILSATAGYAQTAQVGADRGARGEEKITVEYVGYRAARWEEETITEYENLPRNEGGLVNVYLKNGTTEPVDLKFWRLNGDDESYWRLNRHIAWDRTFDTNLPPGGMTVVEINSPDAAFAKDKPFEFQYVDRSWKPASRYKGTLTEDAVQISFVRVLPGLQDFEIYLRHTGTGKVTLEDLGIVGQETERLEWAGKELDGTDHAIARLRLKAPFPLMNLGIFQLTLREGDAARTIYTHRRVFEDVFPIGTWSGRDDTFADLRRIHIDTFVGGGQSSDPLFTEQLPKYNLKTMVHTGVVTNVDTLRDLGGLPSVACWMIHDEPDWSIPSNIMLWADETVRRYNKTKPTFITLCRNIKFFEYAPIADIPGQDHYSVTAPSSSKWPKPYGTRLEETAYYTRDLKVPSEPKPIWIWTQGVADWGERPKRPVPTPDELAAQLLLNIGRGAKGILWFNYSDKLAQKFPDVRDAMRDWGRTMVVLREDFLASDPIDARVKAPDLVDVAVLAGWDKLVLCVTNLDYEIHPEAYPWKVKKDVQIRLQLPDWIQPAAAVELTPNGVRALPHESRRDFLTVTLDKLDTCTYIVLGNDKDLEQTLKAKLDTAIAAESATFE